MTTIEWAIGAAGGGLVVLVGAFVALMRAAYLLGQKAAVIEKVATKFEKLEQHIEMIPQHAIRLGTLEAAVSRIASDIRELLRERRGSRPDFSNGASGGGFGE